MLRREGLRDCGYTVAVMLLVAVTAPLRAADSQAAQEKSKEKAAVGDAAASEEKPEPKKVRLARLVVEGSLAEAPTGGGLLGEIGTDLRKFMERIEKAADDEKIAGLVLEFKSPSLSPGRVHELRETIARFRKSGKKVHAYFESAYAGDYQVACACDAVYMPESGDITVPGVYAEMTFFKGLFDKLGLHADFMHVGEAKGAAEPFTRKEMSEPVKKNMTDLVDDLYNQMVEQIAVGRKLPAEKVKELIDKGVFVAEAAKEAGLVDELVYEDELRELLAKEYNTDELVYVVNYGKQKVDTDFSGTMGFIKLLQAVMGADTPEARSKSKKIAVVYAVGPIFSGESMADLFGGAVMGSDTIVKALREAGEDKDVVAVVLRIDSPGGSALASDMIWRATRALDKPIVASMGDVAGSGGYYIAMGCDQIYAEPGTVTGSIGVVGGKIAMNGLYDKVGVTTDSISRGKNAGIFNSSTPWNEAEREAIRQLMADIYEQFTTKAAEGRRMPMDRLQELAGGKVYTGRDAKQFGLVDELGTMREAVQAAKRLAGVDEDEKVELLILPEAPSFFEALLGKVGEEEREVSLAAARQIGANGMGRGALLPILGAAEPDLTRPLKQANRLRMLFQRPGAALVMPYYLDIR
jgi:protease-4